jgi:hypothetical protein
MSRDSKSSQSSPLFKILNFVKIFFKTKVVMTGRQSNALKMAGNTILSFQYTQDTIFFSFLCDIETYDLSSKHKSMWPYSRWKCNSAPFLNFSLSNTFCNFHAQREIYLLFKKMAGISCHHKNTSVSFLTWITSIIAGYYKTSKVKMISLDVCVRV